MNKLSSSDLIVVFKGNSVDAEIVKEILSDNGILVSLKNQLMGSVAPWHVSPRRSCGTKRRGTKSAAFDCGVIFISSSVFFDKVKYRLALKVDIPDGQPLIHKNQEQYLLTLFTVSNL